MAWSFFEKLPAVQTVKFVKGEIQLQERKKDLQEHWPKCLAATDGNVEKAKDMFVDIVISKPVWLAVVQLADPPRKAELLRHHVNYLLRTTSVPTSLPATSFPSTSTSGMMASLNIDSSVPGADIEIDGAFVGNTPSTVAVAAGSHQIAVKKQGFADWKRTLNVTGGMVHLSAELEQEQPKQ
jgi:hypothetical protein